MASNSKSSTLVRTSNQATAEPAYQRVANELRQLILSGYYKPGDRLPIEPDMCEQFQVSRSTIREALKLLSSQDLVATVRGVTGGTFVTPPAVAHMSEDLLRAMRRLLKSHAIETAMLLEVREALEVTAAASAAERRTDADLEALRESIVVPAERKNLARLFDCGWRFHTAVVEAAHNPVLSAVAGPLLAVTRPKVMLKSAKLRDWQQSNAAHGRIVKLIADQDVDGAAAVMRRHLCGVSEYVRS